MATRDVELALRMSADVDQVTSGFSKVGSSAGDMARDVDKAGKVADGASGRLDRVAGSAENLDDKAGRTTGALGALAAGFEVAGMEKYAAGLETAAMATDGLSGVGQTLSLVMETSAVAKARDAAMTVRSKVVNVAATTATKTMTVAQKALNLAMRANPLGIAITAGLLLAGLFITLYKRSDRFRDLVNKVGDVGRRALGWIVDRAGDLVDRFGDLRAKVGEVTGWVRDKLSAFGEKVANLAGLVKDKLAGAFDLVKDPIQWIVDKVEWVIDKLASLDLPDWLPGVGRAAPGSFTSPAAAAAVTSTNGPVINNTINLYGIAASGSDVVRQLRALFEQYGMQLGVVVP